MIKIPKKHPQKIIKITILQKNPPKNKKNLKQKQKYLN